jgi:cysteine desulfurase
MENFDQDLSGASDRLYLDWNATAPLRSCAKDAWIASCEDDWANANSLHREGKRALARLDAARQTLAEITRTQPGEWIFTSGATESIHAALYGAANARGGKRRIVTSQGEHACTRAVLADLEEQGYEIHEVGLSRSGQWDPFEVLMACDPAVTVCASLIWANNETGAVSPVEEVASELRKRRIPLHLDAVQVPGRLPMDLGALEAGLVSISGHKFGAPKGIGALHVRRGTAWAPWMLGGEQERSRRAGTSNVAGASAMAAALAEAAGADFAAIAVRRDRFERELAKVVPGILVLGQGSPRLPNTSALSVQGVESSPLLLRLDDRGIAVSSGSACTSGRTDPSPVLLAMGLTPGQAHGTIRVSMGDSTTDADLDRLIEVLAQEVPALR